MLRADQSQTESRAFKKFLSSINSDKTVQRYIYGLDKFCEYTSLTYEEILVLDVEDLTTKIEDWVMSKTGLRQSSILTPLAGLEKFLDVNRKLYHKKSIHSLVIADKDMGGGGEPFTTLDIQKMLQVTTSLRMKAVIHFMNSLGIRPAGLTDPVLKKKHLIDMPNGCYAIRIYDNTKEGYWGFLTPEARKALDHYLDSRRLNGERITDESPLFTNTSKRAKTSHMKNDTLYELLGALYRKAGIERKKVGNRYDKSLTYGFRKRFNTILKINSSVNSNIAEKLMGHKKGLDGAYLTPTRDECFAEFVKAITDLTIDDSERKNIKIEKLEKEKSELEKSRVEIKEMKKRMDDLEYGPERRNGLFAKDMLDMEKGDPDIRTLRSLFNHLFELRYSEEEKREIFKKIVEANPDEKLKLAEIFHLIPKKDN